MIYKELPSPVIRVNQKCTRDLFVKINEGYRLFAANGAIYTEQQSNLFHKVKMKLYITAQDQEAADEYLNNYLGEFLSDPAVSSKHKAEYVYSNSMTSIRRVFEGTNGRTLADLEKTAQDIVKLVLADKRVINDLITITSFDHFIYKHSIKVGVYGTALAVNLFGERITEHRMVNLSMGFFLHDIGMEKVPKKILDKKGPLTDDEWEIIKKHPQWGHDRLVKAGYISDEAAAIVLHHHERNDEKGYPFGKSGKGIPLYAKICAIADTFESLTSGRPFKKPRSPFEALKTMQTEMAREFDADLFKAFITLLTAGK